MNLIIMMIYLNFILVGKTSITIITHRNRSARRIFTFWVAVSLVSDRVLTEALPLPTVGIGDVALQPLLSCRHGSGGGSGGKGRATRVDVLVGGGGGHSSSWFLSRHDI